MKIFTSKSQLTGKKGENIAASYLQSKGFSIVDRNFGVLYGEIDIVALKRGVYHFVEIKTVTREISNIDSFQSGQFIRPEENFHDRKINRFKKTCAMYLSQKNISHETEWQADLITVSLDTVSKIAYVNFLQNAIA